MSGQEARQEPGLIEIRVEKLAQLFHGLDPYPFREKDLDKDAVLFLSELASQTIARRIEPRALGKVIEESLLIFAWVANWRPIEIFLYEWWPIVRRRDLYRRLGEAEVELRPYKLGEERRQVLPKE